MDEDEALPAVQFVLREKMRRVRVAILICVLSLVVPLIIGCSASSDEPSAQTDAATAVTESSEGADSSPPEQIPGSSREVPRISVDELKERLDSGQEIVLIDNRSESDYQSGHIDGAIFVPSVNVASPIDDLALDQEIVLYCD